MKKFLRLTHGAGVPEEKMDFDEKRFYNYIICSKSSSKSYYSKKTAENYVAAISELYVMLTKQYGISLDYNSPDFMNTLNELKNGDLIFEEQYLVGKKATDNFKSMNVAWKGTYSAAIKLFNRYMIETEEITHFFETDFQYDEGNLKDVNSLRYERDSKARKACIKLKGHDCSVCEMNFKEEYGQIGESYIHVHHQKPLHSYDGRDHTSVIDDLYPLCPNCHAMIHRSNPIFSVEEFKQHYKKKSKKR